MDPKQEKEKSTQSKASLDAHVSTFRIENLASNELDTSELSEQIPCSKSLVSAKRAAQNRAAQRAFRQRKEQHIKGLESKAKLLDMVMRNNLKLKVENETLWQIVNKVKNGESIHNLVLPEKVQLEDEGKVQQETMSYFEESAQDEPSYMANYSQKEETISPTFRIKTFNSALEDKRFSSPVPPCNQGKTTDFRRLSFDSNSTTSSCSFSPVNFKALQRRPSSHGFVGPNASTEHSFAAGSSPTTIQAPRVTRNASVMSLNEEKHYSYQHNQTISTTDTSSADSKQVPVTRYDSISNLQSSTYSPSRELTSPHFNPEGANLAFLQYGWIFDSHTPQPDKGGNYTGIFGMSQRELDQNHQIMNNLHSLLKMDPELTENQEEIPKPSPTLSSKPVGVN